VDEVASRKKEWVLTQEAFDGLLAALDPNRESAAERYEIVRRKLVRFFELRGSSFPEDHADEAINRVIRRLQSGEEVMDIDRYFYGVARLLLMEILREPGRQRTSLHEMTPAYVTTPEPAEQSLREECFQRCLSTLPPETRELIVQYYLEEKRSKIKNREELARRLGIPPNALRIRAHRIRGRLEACVVDCLRRSTT
jgi:RNA polymerase sigma factor (sigma-70 family)